MLSFPKTATAHSLEKKTETTQGPQDKAVSTGPEPLLVVRKPLLLSLGSRGRPLSVKKISVSTTMQQHRHAAGDTANEHTGHSLRIYLLLVFCGVLEAQKRYAKEFKLRSQSGSSFRNLRWPPLPQSTTICSSKIPLHIHLATHSLLPPNTCRHRAIDTAAA